FFQAEDGIRDFHVTGVQTCALPISLMRGMKHIPVDRNQGDAAYAHALNSLRSGEIVGVFPEATISQSFTLKSFKSGAARMAQEAGVPLIPMAVWGTQRLWTKGHPRNFKRSHTPITIRVGRSEEHT